MTALSGYAPHVDFSAAIIDSAGPKSDGDLPAAPEENNPRIPAAPLTVAQAGPVIARFKVIEWRLAVERTDHPNEFALSVNQPRWPRHIAAHFTVDASGSYRSHQRASPHFFDTEVDDWVRRAVWKVINHRATGRTVLQW